MTTAQTIAPFHGELTTRFSRHSLYITIKFKIYFVQATIKAHISEVLMGNSSFSVDMKVDGIIPFKFTCPVCGTTCTVTIPIVKQTTSFQLPDCPVTGDFNLVEPIALPSKSPIGVSSGAKGTVQVTNGAGTVVAHVTVDATLKPSFNSEEL
mmetsp:Transcript_45842/g.73735  ORF Transcript_45842/g.73735 Transcript_45842/m.73735 type:complete len:152 (-) Transcript_45842:214-669(-)